MIGCVVVSDREDLYLPGCLANLATVLPDTIPIHVVDDRTHRLGLAGAARRAWEIALDEDWTHLLHWEEDFRSHAPVPLESMRFALDRMPELSQVVLKRQPWSVEEKAAGGIIEMHPDLYEERGFFGRNFTVTVHRRIFSLNPSLIPRRVLEMGWPDGNEAEMTERLNEDPANLFAFLGGRADSPLVEHVGAVRSAQWSL